MGRSVDPEHVILLPVNVNKVRVVVLIVSWVLLVVLLLYMGMFSVRDVPLERRSGCPRPVRALPLFVVPRRYRIPMVFVLWVKAAIVRLLIARVSRRFASAPVSALTVRVAAGRLLARYVMIRLPGRHTS